MGLLQVRCPSCHQLIRVKALKGTHSINFSPVAWPHPLFINHWTPDGKGVASFMLSDASTIHVGDLKALGNKYQCSTKVDDVTVFVPEVQD